jgi:hypothetical protein
MDQKEPDLNQMLLQNLMQSVARVVRALLVMAPYLRALGAQVVAVGLYFSLVEVLVSDSLILWEGTLFVM